VQAVDTNLLVRLFVVDDTEQAARARKLFDRHAGEDGALWLADIVLVELVWALDRVYGRDRAQIAAALAALSGNATVRLESAPAVVEAAALYAAGPCDFADCLLATKARAAGCEAVRTFDKGMRSLPDVKLL
jgi:predicted nucleic-acid-binding protein